MYLLIYQCEIDYMDWKRSYFMSETVNGRRKKKRILWNKINKQISNTHFPRMFRMNRDYFTLLCDTRICGIGEHQFKSKTYIDAFPKHKDIMYNTHMETTGGYIVR